MVVLIRLKHKCKLELAQPSPLPQQMLVVQVTVMEQSARAFRVELLRIPICGRQVLVHQVCKTCVPERT
jgi:hypothetical protein